MRGNSTELVGSTSRPMHVIEAAIYRGPHLFSATPMIRIQLDLGDLESWPTDRLPGFSDRLLALLPGLGEHECSLGHAGGFRIRLHEGTWLGHVAEHIAIELQSLAGGRGARGEKRAGKGGGGGSNAPHALLGEGTGRLAGRLPPAPGQYLLPPAVAGGEG